MLKQHKGKIINIVVLLIVSAVGIQSALATHEICAEDNPIIPSYTSPKPVLAVIIAIVFLLLLAFTLVLIRESKKQKMPAKLLIAPTILGYIVIFICAAASGAQVCFQV